MDYYIYNNWQANKDSYKMHRADCGDCQSGKGKHCTKEYGDNGVWIGPFKTIEYAKKYISIKGVKAKECSRCPKDSIKTTIK